MLLMGTSSSCQFLLLDIMEICIDRDLNYSYNDLQAIDQQNLQIRTSSSLSANGFYFS
jgi:hypothetical protein